MAEELIAFDPSKMLTLVSEVRPHEIPVTKLVNLSTDAAVATGRER